MIDPRIDDATILRSVGPSDLGLYVRSLAWSPEPEAGGIAWVEDPESDDSDIIFVPKSRDMKGYPGYVRDALAKLSERQNRTQVDVLLSIRSATRDTQFIRTQPDAESGTSPILDSSTTINGIQQWILSAAVSVSSTRTAAIQPARKPVEATEFMRSVHLGSPLPGSFVFVVYLPVPVELGPQPLDLEHPALQESSTPFARRVSLRLQDASELALNAATDVANGAGNLESFSSGIERGISANFCEALAAMAGEQTRPFSLDFDWAAVRPIERRRRPLRFEPSHVEVISEAARTLRAVAVEEDVRLVGNVVRLHRESNFGPGEVSLLGYVEDDKTEKICRVWMELGEDDYSTAVTAHDRGFTVSVSGALKRSGNRTRLTGVRGFTSWQDAD